MSVVRIKNKPQYMFKKYTNRRIYRLQRQLNSLKPEKKHLYSNWDAQGVGTPGTAPLNVDLIGVATGTGENQRVGNKVKVTGIYADFILRVDPTDSSNNFRLLIYIPKEDQQSVLNTAYWVHPDQDQYTILYDKLVCLSATGGPACRRVKIRLNFARKGKSGINVQFHGNNATDFGSNAIKLHVVSDSGVAAHPTLSGYIYTYYTDS